MKSDLNILKYEFYHGWVINIIFNTIWVNDQNVNKLRFFCIGLSDYHKTFCELCVEILSSLKFKDKELLIYHIYV